MGVKSSKVQYEGGHFIVFLIFQFPLTSLDYQLLITPLVKLPNFDTFVLTLESDYFFLQRLVCWLT